jgi:membrane associated rhomboid family serine protease
MLADRYYMRRPAFGSFWSVTTMLLAANVVVFLLQEAFKGSPVINYFPLSLEGLRHGYVWQLLTFQFMHGGWIHLLVNCWALYLFGRELEESLGRKSYLALYFSSGVIGGLFQVLAAAVASHFPDSVWAARFGGPTVGASAGVFGLTAAFALIYPDRQFMLFPIPINISARVLLWFSAGLAVIGLSFSRDNVAHAAHVGGLLTGVLFIRYAIHWRWPEFRRTPAPMPRRRVKVHPGTSAAWGQNESIARDEDLAPEEFVSRAVDPILDKISAHGIQSLTDRERRILETARQKMVKR